MDALARACGRTPPSHSHSHREQGRNPSSGSFFLSCFRTNGANEMSGSSKGRTSFAEAVEPRRRSFAEQIAWAKRTLPDECPGFVVVAASVVSYRGESVTVDAIRAQLEATGRLASQLEERVV